MSKMQGQGIIHRDKSHMRDDNLHIKDTSERISQIYGDMTNKPSTSIVVRVGFKSVNKTDARSVTIPWNTTNKPSNIYRGRRPSRIRIPTEEVEGYKVRNLVP